MLKEKELYQQALEKWGIDSQCMMAIEEMSELTKELSKFKRYGPKYHIQNIKEEIADVTIMLEQLKLIFKFSEEDIDIIKQQKLNRLEEYLNKEKE